MTALLAGAVDATLLLAGALLVAAALRRRPASVRHGVLTAGLGAAALALLFELTLPQLPLIRLPEAGPVQSSGLLLASVEAAIAVPSAGVEPQSGGLPWPALLLIVWVTGGLLTGAALLTSLIRLFRLTGQCVPMAGGSWCRIAHDLSCAAGMRRRVQILQCPSPDLLVSSGVLRPRIILPAGAGGWSEDRQRIVLAHELAHIRRYDGAIQLAGELLRIVYWFNPLVWLTCRRLRQESEYACDDVVLRGGVEATDYASHLLEIARQVARQDRVWATAPGITHSSTLERRIVAMLHSDRSRDALPARAWALGFGAALAISLPLAAVGVAPPEGERATGGMGRDVFLNAAVRPGSLETTPRESVLQPVPTARRPAALPEAAAASAARQVAGAITGTVIDQFGGTLPGAQLTLTDSQTAIQFSVVTDASGRFAFRDLLPASYSLVAGLPGFASVSHKLTLASSEPVHRTITLPLGTLEETITVVCASPVARSGLSAVSGIRMAAGRIVSGMFPVVAAQGSPVMPVRVGGNVRPPMKVTNVNPVCPPAAVPATETSVRLAGRVGADGVMYDVTHLVAPAGMESPAELTQAALEAVRQWTFTPTLLNGRPVDVNIAVHVRFRRD